MRRATLVCVLAACGSTAESPNLPADGGTATVADAPAGGSPDGAPPVGGLITLVDGEWALPPHSEQYRCVRKTVTQDMFIVRFDPILPLGTHHTVLTVGAPSGPDGITVCGGTVAKPNMIYGSGVNTPAMDLPPGVAMKVEAGEQLLLNLHLFNTSAAPLSGRSGIRVKLVDAAEVHEEAEALLAGTLSLAIPPGTHTFSGTCTMSGATTLFAVGPHMHQLGIHQKVSIVGGETLLDRDYTFDNQTFDLVDVQLVQGQAIRVDCTYANPNDEWVFWGESSTAEMCFAIVYRYPSSGRFNVCTD